MWPDGVAFSRLDGLLWGCIFGIYKNGVAYLGYFEGQNSLCPSHTYRAFANFTNVWTERNQIKILSQNLKNPPCFLVLWGWTEKQTRGKLVFLRSKIKNQVNGSDVVNMTWDIDLVITIITITIIITIIIMIIIIIIIIIVLINS